MSTHRYTGPSSTLLSPHALDMVQVKNFAHLRKTLRCDDCGRVRTRLVKRRGLRLCGRCARRLAKT